MKSPSERFIRYRFEELEVWSLGMRIVREAYQVTKLFPKSEAFALCDQLKRAATSITLNVAEGSGQPTKKGFAVYIHRAKSSALECVACLRIAVQEGYAKTSDTGKLEELLKEEYFKLIALYKSLSQ